MTPRRQLIPETASVRIWFWNSAGAQTFVCSARDAAEHRKRLLAEGAVVWHTEVYEL